MQTEFSLADLTRVTGAKRRSVQLWAEAGVIEAIPETERAGTGVHRTFSREEAIIACIITPLASMKISIGELKTLAKYVRELIKSEPGSIGQAVAGDPVYILFDRRLHSGKFRITIVAPAIVYSRSEEAFDGAYERTKGPVSRLVDRVVGGPKEAFMEIAGSRKRAYREIIGQAIQEIEEGQDSSLLIMIPLHTCLKSLR
ncbi:MAG TPA: hypothetical protein VGX71_16480 [Pseudaminobacter sp.]|nr:hypothetical protein [Pseudaminobacter sp.]